MNQAERARQIAQRLQEALLEAVIGIPAEACSPGKAEIGARQDSRSFTVSRRAGCLACDPGSCPECGYLFTGELVTIEHRLKGKLTLSDKAIHYLAHGITHYQTSYIVRGEPVIVDLDLEELAGYLDL